MFYGMTHPAIQMAGPIRPDKKSLDISYCDLLILGRELKDAPGYFAVADARSLPGNSQPVDETPGLLHS
jgi:hypothetical protein